MDLADRTAMAGELFARQFERVIHLGAQAGVRYSLDNPSPTPTAISAAPLTVLEAPPSRVQHLVYASSSSVYGLNEQMPFKTSDGVDHPVSLYAGEQEGQRVMALLLPPLRVAHHWPALLHRLRPWGDPDMALFKFVRAIPEQQAHRHLQPGPAQPGLHPYRRHRGREQSGSRTGPRSATRPGRGRPTPARPPTASSTSAMAARCDSWISWEAIEAALGKPAIPQPAAHAAR